jgi:acyl-lipid (7-3)-desaturase (Delta-4 desaturase)
MLNGGANVAELLGFGADLIGGSKYLWLQQHWTHHAFTNDVTKDPDASVLEYRSP